MNLYTFAEIVEDIEIFEGIEFKLPKQFDEFKFTKLYSEVNKHFISSKSAMREIDSRVKRFFTNKTHMLAKCDILPSDEYPFFIYEYEIPESKLPCDVHLILAGAFQSKDKIREWLTCDETQPKFPNVCIVDTKVGEIIHYHRQSDGPLH